VIISFNKIIIILLKLCLTHILFSKSIAPKKSLWFLFMHIYLKLETKVKSQLNNSSNKQTKEIINQTKTYHYNGLQFSYYFDFQSTSVFSCVD
jgi:hypothetical protein